VAQLFTLDGIARMKHPCQILVEHELGAVSDAQLISWACEVLCGSDALAKDSTVTDLAALDSHRDSDLELAGGFFRQVVQRHFPDFQFQSPDGIRWARETIKRRCEDYLERRITPCEFCSVVSPVEQHFDFPQWLGDLFNACDWVDGHTKREDVPYLEDEARRLHDAV
jgi:hypothetical protein